MKLQFTTTKIESTLIKGIDYHSGILTLDLGKSLYSYYKVPAKTALELLGAESIGKYFNDHIKDSFDFLELQ